MINTQLTAMSMLVFWCFYLGFSCPLMEEKERYKLNKEKG